MREGISATGIAHDLALRGELEVGERTMADYIQFYKRYYPESIKQKDSNSIEEIVKVEHINPVCLNELNKLLRLQKLRLAYGYSKEKARGVLDLSMSKEIRIVKDIIDSIHKIQSTTDEKVDIYAYEYERKGEKEREIYFARLKRDEEQQRIMIKGVEQLAKMMEESPKDKDLHS